MKIFIACLFLPQEKASHAGGRYVYEVVKRLSVNHEVHLATRLDSSEQQGLTDLENFCTQVIPYFYTQKANRNIFTIGQLLCNYLGFSASVNQILKSTPFDIAMVEWVEAGILVSRHKTPMILDAHDVITKPAERQLKNSHGSKKLVYLIKFLFTKYIELFITKKFDLIFTRSNLDKKYLQSMCRELEVDIVPHPAGLDISDKDISKDTNSILFLASYKFRAKNVDAALYFYKSIFPIIRKEIPDSKFIAAGYGPTKKMKDLSLNDPGIEVPGFVDDIDTCYKKATVFVAPILTGGGIIVKILDALAAGTPVVTTSFGNEGIEATPGRDLLVADDPETFAQAVLRIMNDPEFAKNLAKNGQKFVKKNYSTEAIMEKIESSFTEIQPQ